MDARSLGGRGEGRAPRGETVCEALSRFEETLLEAVAELSSFKVGVTLRLEEVGGVPRAVARLQEENLLLRSQLEELTRQVELLTCGSGLPPSDLHGNHQEVKDTPSGGHTHSSSPPSVTPRIPPIVSSPSHTHFSSRATLAVSTKTSDGSNLSTCNPVLVLSSGVQSRKWPCVSEQLTEGDPPRGSAGLTERLELVHGTSSERLREHAAPFATRRPPHVPVTAMTRTAALPVTPRILNGSQSSLGPELSLPNWSIVTPDLPLTDPSESQRECSLEELTMNRVPALGAPGLQDKVQTLTHSGIKHQSGLTPNRSFGGVSDRRRALVRSQTLPRNIGTQSQFPVVERLDTETSTSKEMESKPRLKRSQSFGVSSASTIKQILLEWCRLKTVGYQNVDVQNFSSSWSDGMAFCALVHSFFPKHFDYRSLSAANRKHNFELAFGTAESKADCERLIEVDDMMVMGHKPDPMCVFTYVQFLYHHLRKFE